MNKGTFAKDFPVVCVGGSAGGLDAYTRLLQHLPADLGVAIDCSPLVFDSGADWPDGFVGTRKVDRILPVTPDRPEGFKGWR